MPRWSMSVEVDVSFPAPDEDTAWVTGEQIASAMAERLLGRTPPGWRRRSAIVTLVEMNAQPGAILPMEP